VAKLRGAALFGLDPGTALPGRVVADVPGVSAGEIGDPVMLFVLMEAGDWLGHAGPLVGQGNFLRDAGAVRRIRAAKTKRGAREGSPWPLVREGKP